MSVPDKKALQMPEALCRTRTGDPFLTMDGPPSSPVTSGPNESPHGATQPATSDPAGPPERPQDAPSWTDRLWHGIACAVVATLDPFLLWSLGKTFAFTAPGWAYAALWLLTTTIYAGPLPRLTR